MIDAHFHLDFFPRAEIPDLLRRALARGVRGGVLAGVWNDEARALGAWMEAPGSVAPQLRVATRSDALAPRADDADSFLLHVAFGLHPAEVARRCVGPAGERGARAADRLEEAIEMFEDLVERNASHVRAIGETGFDAHPHVAEPARAAGLDKAALLALQERAFEACARVAAREGLPLIVHSRGSWERTLAAVRRARERGVGKIMFHCFGGPAQDAARLADEGFFLSFGGVPTWAKARKVRDAFLACPDRALLVETDGPDLPVEFGDGTRPERHDPEHLVDVSARLAALRGMDEGGLRALSDANLARWLSCPEA